MSSNHDNLYIDVHVLQDLPPSNVNRDDNGTPKTAMYGGVERLRVSSQAWKRATRLDFQDRLGQETLGVRTRRLRGMLVESVVEHGRDRDSAGELADAALKLIGLRAAEPKKRAVKEGKEGKAAKDTPAEPQLQYLLFVGRPQIATLGEHLASLDSAADVTGDAVIGTLTTGHTLDVALFGRMVADMTQLNVDAAVQVAHAISTHAAPVQVDYYTAVDDRQASDETGAGMIGTIEFNAGTMYRFASVAFPRLVDNLGGETEAAAAGLETFLRSFVLSMPSGHASSFAPRTRPALVAVIVRRDQPVNLVSAFERPVYSRHGLVEPSVDRIASYVKDETERWGDRPELVVASYSPTQRVGDDASKESAKRIADAFGPSLDLSDLIAKVGAVARSHGDD